jgi:hypothetical protein
VQISSAFVHSGIRFLFRPAAEFWREIFNGGFTSAGKSMNPAYTG